MKFLFDKVGKGRVRLGKLSDFGLQKDIFQTPNFILTTQGGTVPHLTPDVLEKALPEHHILSIPAQHFHYNLATLEKYQKGIANFIGFSDKTVSVPVQDVCSKTPTGINDKRGVKIISRSCRVNITLQQYMELIEVMEPDWFEVLNDSDTPMNASRNRLEKSLSRSENYLEETFEFISKSQKLKKSAVFAPLLGGYDLDRRKKWTTLVNKDSIAGYTLLGFHNNGSDVMQMKVFNFSHIIKGTLDSLAEDKPIQAPGAWNPCAIIDLCLLGIDLFDTSYPYFVTEDNRALVFPCCLSEDSNDSDAPIEHENKKIKMDETELVQNGKEENNLETNLETYTINLKDKIYFEEKGPILKGCQCYTCENFTLSYIHHLTVTKEMLGMVLLKIHNLHHWNKFFESIRESISKETLSQLRHCITNKNL